MIRGRLARFDQVEMIHDRYVCCKATIPKLSFHSYLQSTYIMGLLMVLVDTHGLHELINHRNKGGQTWNPFLEPFLSLSAILLR